jgi:hypothetical protein
MIQNLQKLNNTCLVSQVVVEIPPLNVSVGVAETSFKRGRKKNAYF